ncbi:hypothetical protein QCA50_003575 [Cerrena zonata]|uniref:Uncharacterized protein n=1 Tax=Cerrena zonata TaxID=2478898 RepID=A0AAW0GWN4_9APHY
MASSSQLPRKHPRTTSVSSTLDDTGQSQASNPSQDPQPSHGASVPSDSDIEEIPPPSQHKNIPDGEAASVARGTQADFD